MINAHDHLHFNLFPRLGSPPYPNSYAWGRDIYHPQNSPIKEILAVPLNLRLLWGAYKNILSGVTTVVHHETYYRRVFTRGFPVKVLRRYRWAHSLGFGGDIGRAYRTGRGPFIIHAAEGTDEICSDEVPRLKALGVLGADTVIVHGIALSNAQIEQLSQLSVSMVWCPVTSQYLYEALAPVHLLRGKVRMALGTDSTLTGAPTLWDEMRAVLQTGLVSPAEVFRMVTSAPAEIFGLSDGRGRLSSGAPADVILLPEEGRSGVETLVAGSPLKLALSLVDGNPIFGGEAFFEELNSGAEDLWLGPNRKWVRRDFRTVVSKISRLLPAPILDMHPLWKMVQPDETNQ